MNDTHATTLLLSALLLPLTACGTTVLGGGGGGGGGTDTSTTGTTGTSVTVTSTSTTGNTSSSTGSGTGSSTGSGTGPRDGETSTVAILLADLPSPPEGPDGVGAPIVWTGTGAAPAGALVLLWSNELESCETGYVGSPMSGVAWQAALVLPPELVQVGLVDLSAPGVGAFTYNYFAGNGGGGGGGASMSGRMEIVSIDATSITVNLLTGLTAWGGGTDNGITYAPVVLTGTYTLPKC